MTAGDVVDRSAAFLADPGKSFFTFALLSPYVEQALDELQVELIDNGSQFLKKNEDRTLEATNDAEEISFDDLVEPLKVSVVEENRLYDAEQQSSQLEWGLVPARINIWTWTGSSIRVGPHTARNNVRFLYYRQLMPDAELTTETAIAFPNSKIFLASRAAALAAQLRGMNDKLADRLNRQAYTNLAKLISRDVKSQQSIITIRRPYFRTGRRSIEDFQF